MKINGRKLSHEEHEVIRFKAVKAAQAGETPTAVLREMGLYTKRRFGWLAGYRAGGWDVLRSRKAAVGRSGSRASRTVATGYLDGILISRIHVPFPSRC